jgi:hypothetical protein
LPPTSLQIILASRDQRLPGSVPGLPWTVRHFDGVQNRGRPRGIVCSPSNVPLLMGTMCHYAAVPCSFPGMPPRLPADYMHACYALAIRATGGIDLVNEIERENK